jgi:hypothetical protein
MNHHDIDQLLEPLKNRSDLEPDQAFVLNLKQALTKTEKKPLINRFNNYNWKVITSMCTVIILVVILSASYLTKHTFISLTKSESTSDIKKHSKEKSQTFNELLKSNPNYDKLYKKLVATTGIKEQSKTVIYYFEAIKNKDADAIRKYTDKKLSDEVLNEMFHLYENFDLKNFKFQNMTLQVDKDEFHIGIDPNIKATNKESAMKTHGILLIFHDTQDVYIQDSFLYSITEGKVIEKRDNMILVDEIWPMSQSRTYFSTDNKKILNGIKVGQTVLVWHDGILESYPGKSHVLKIKVVDK